MPVSYDLSQNSHNNNNVLIKKKSSLYVNKRENGTNSQHKVSELFGWKKNAQINNDCLINGCLWLPSTNSPFHRYGGHSELIRFKEDYRMPRGYEHISFVFSSAFRDIFS